MPDVALPDIDWKKPDHDAIFTERMRRLSQIRNTPGMLAGLKAFYKDNPAQFICDWGITFDPRNAEIGLPVKMAFILFPRQIEAIDWLVARWRGREDGLVEKSRDMGLSWLCVSFAVWMWLFYPESVIGFGSRKEEYVDRIGDPKALFWKAREFIDGLPIEFQPAGWDSTKHAPFMRILNPENGSAIVGEAGDNIGRGNRTGIYFKDESGFYERPDAIDAALSQTSNCKIDISTPNGVGNPFYRKRHGGKLPVFVFDWRDDPRKDDAWYQRQCDTLEAHVVAQEIDRNYSASVTNAYISADTANEALRRGPANVPAVGGLRVGVDPARFGDDKFAVAIRRGRLLIAQHETGKVDSIQGAAYVRALLLPFNEAPEQIAVDEIGIGAGVVDQLGVLYPGGIVVGVNSSLRMDGEEAKRKRIDSTVELCYNLRAQMWREMKEWLAGASIPNDPELVSELASVRYTYRGGSLLLESKDDMKRRGVKSPNKADSLAMTFAVPGTMKTAVLNHPFFQNYNPAAHAPATTAGY